MKLNLVYPHRDPATPSIIYQSSLGEIWGRKTPAEDSPNIGMGVTSIPHPKPNDSFLTLEPYCVSTWDYNPEYLKPFKYIFTWATKAFENTSLRNKVIEINHGSCYDRPDRKIIRSTWPKWNERKDEIVFIANNKTSHHYSELYSLRLQLADLFHQYSKYQVKWYGQSAIDRPYYCGPIESKHEILKQVKFSVCTENCYDPIYSHNYFTEKLPEVWFAGCVPLYFGCYNIDQFNFASHSYIDLRIYCQRINGQWQIGKDYLFPRLDGFKEDRYNNFLDDIEWHWNRPENNLYDIISFDRMYETILKTYKS